MAIVIDEARCSGCRACELACVARRDARFGTATARIRVVKIEAAGIDRPSLCRQCADAPCVGACPTGALTTDGGDHTVRFSPDDCVVCPACAAACPYEVVVFDAATGMPLICDLCGGDPACVGRCVTGALSWAEPAPERRAAPGAPGADRV
jgi:carbon-monoxide dehydrogenase iron sulfur subunit